MVCECPMIDPDTGFASDDRCQLCCFDFNVVSVAFAPRDNVACRVRRCGAVTTRFVATGSLTRSTGRCGASDSNAPAARRAIGTAPAPLVPSSYTLSGCPSRPSLRCCSPSPGDRLEPLHSLTAQVPHTSSVRKFGCKSIGKIALGYDETAESNFRRPLFDFYVTAYVNFSVPR
jgi:hypothetical protein